ncbi:MAG TPA: PASTA domain-containing protein [Terriglobales bacterium]|nr:PASTA domain-containing protein [Terriglobales bacterium]
MRRALRFVLLGLVLLLVMMFSALTAMRFAIHGREVKVPNLVGRTIADAEEAANAQGLILMVENKFYSDKIAAGHIVSQYPAPGSQVRRGWRVRGAESMGPQKAEIPNLIGQSTRAAEINASRRGLELASVSVAKLEGVPPGQVIAQNPPPQASGVISPKISLLMAAPEEDEFFVMPSFIGKHLAEVAPKLEEAGMKLGNLTEAASADGAETKSKIFGEGTIILKQTPPPGQRIPAGATINFVISR